MAYRISFIAAIFLVFVLSAVVHAETTGTINFSTQNVSVTTGIFGYTVSTCSSNSDCFGYQCFLDFDTVGTYKKSFGLCNATSVKSCIHDTSSGTFSVVADSYFYCTGNTTYVQCSSSNWSSSQSCTSGQTCSIDSISSSNPCSSPSTSSSSYGGGSSSQTTATTSNRIVITSAPSSIEIVQGNSSSTSITFKNTGNATLTNVTLSIPEISSSWYSFTPAQINVLSSGNSNFFNISFSIPQDAEVKSYTMTFNVTAKDGTTDSASATLRVLPNRQTISTINQTLMNYSLLLKEIEDNLTNLESKCSNENDVQGVKQLINNAKSKIAQANASITQNDYFNAKLLLDEAKDLIDAASRQLSQVRPAGGGIDTNIIIIIIVAVVAVVIVVAYALWPAKKEIKTLSIFKGK